MLHIFPSGKECFIFLLRHKYKHLMIDRVYLDLGMANQLILHCFLNGHFKGKFVMIVSSIFVPLLYIYLMFKMGYFV